MLSTPVKHLGDILDIHPKMRIPKGCLMSGHEHLDFHLTIIKHQHLDLTQ